MKLLGEAFISFFGGCGIGFVIFVIVLFLANVLLLPGANGAEVESLSESRSIAPEPQPYEPYYPVDHYPNNVEATSACAEALTMALNVSERFVSVMRESLEQSQKVIAALEETVAVQEETILLLLRADDDK